MATGVVAYDSDLVRKKWMRDGLVQAASKSIYAPLTGNSKNAVVYQRNETSAADGHTVVFDFDGNLSNKAIKGKETAVGKGEQKKKFSDKVTVDRYRLVVDNGDTFDGVNIGDLSIHQHSDSRAKLGDLFVRFKDQAIIDSLQGNLGQAPTHAVDLGSTFDINTLTEIERILRTSQGFTTGGVRRPIEPYRMQNGEPVWIFQVDTNMATKLKKSSSYQSLIYNADIRGEQNRAFKGIIGKIGRLLIQEVDGFFGSTADGSTWGLEDTSIEMAGLRQYDTVNGVWTGQVGFDYSSTLKSRGIILGAGAVQLPFGKMPDYKYQPSNDFGIKSESALEVWMSVQKTKLKAETSDYKKAKVAEMDWATIAIDVEI